MSADSKLDLVELREAIKAYAKLLTDTLGHHLGVLADVGKPTSRECYSEATVHSYDPREDAPDQRSIFDKKAPPPPISDRKLLTEWQAENYRQPLLIVAPAGSGKSCLLETFALWMAQQLVDDQSWPSEEKPPPGIPVIVSLAKMAGAPFNEYVLRHAEQHLTRREFSSFTDDQWNYLRSQGCLVLLIDGLDENPQCHTDLVRSLPHWKNQYLLTSRPDHGERFVLRNADRQRTLEDFSDIQAETYVRKYFDIPDSVEVSDQPILNEFIKAWKTHFGRLLRRPLYLKAWCDYVLENPNRNSPASLGKLAELLLRHTLNARHQFQALKQDRVLYNRTIHAFANWFGRLGKYFVDHEFSAISVNTLDEEGLINSEQDQVKHNGHTFHFVEIATQCDLLKLSESDEYFIPKVPLMEYLLGRWLAEDVRRTPDSPITLVQTFRSWIWRPSLHDILDYAFDDLWEKDAHWARNLLLWATITGRHDPTRSCSRSVVTQDDLIYPFVVTVWRWKSLNSASVSSETEAEIDEMIQVTIPSLTEDLSFINLMGESLGNDHFYALLMQMISHKSKFSRRRQEKTEKWWKAAQLASTYSCSERSEREIKRWLTEHDQAKGDHKTQQTLRRDIWNATEHLTSKSAERVFPLLLPQYDKTSEDPKAQQEWRAVIQNAVARINSESAKRIVEQLIIEHNLNREAITTPQVWQLVTWGIGEELISHKDERFITQWMAANDPANENSFMGELRHSAERFETKLSRLNELKTVELGNLLITNNMINAAVRVAINNPSVAIVSNANTSLDPNTDELPSFVYHVVSRKAQQLDPNLVAAPPLIRTAFIEEKLSSLENMFEEGQTAETTVDYQEAIAFIRTQLDTLPLTPPDIQKRRADFIQRLDLVERELGISVPLDNNGTNFRSTDPRSIQNYFDCMVDFGDSDLPHGSQIILREEPTQRRSDIKKIRKFYVVLMFVHWFQVTKMDDLVARINSKINGDLLLEQKYTKTPVNNWLVRDISHFIQQQLGLKSSPALYSPPQNERQMDRELNGTGKHVLFLFYNTLKDEGHLPCF